MEEAVEIPLEFVFESLESHNLHKFQIDCLVIQPALGRYIQIIHLQHVLLIIYSNLLQNRLDYKY